MISLPDLDLRITTPSVARFREDLQYGTVWDGGFQAVWVEYGDDHDTASTIWMRSFDKIGRPLADAQMVASDGARRPDLGLAHGLIVFDRPNGTGEREIVLRDRLGQEDILGIGQGALLLSDNHTVIWRNDQGVASTEGLLWAGIMSGLITTASQKDSSLVVWSGWGVDDHGSGIGAVIVAADGTIGPVTKVNSFAWGNQSAAQVLALPDGGWLVGWSLQMGAGYNHRVQRIDDTGAPIGPEISLPGFSHGPDFDLSVDDDGSVFLTSSDLSWQLHADGSLVVADMSNAAILSFNEQGALRLMHETQLDWVQTVTTPNAVLADGQDMWLSVTLGQDLPLVDVVTYWSPVPYFDLTTARVLDIERDPAIDDGPLQIRIQDHILTHAGDGWLFVRAESRDTGQMSDPIALAQPVQVPKPADPVLMHMSWHAEGLERDQFVLRYEMENRGDQTAWDHQIDFYWSPDGEEDELIFLSSDRLSGISPDRITHGFEAYDNATLSALGNGYILARWDGMADLHDPLPLVISSYDWDG
jgi:hypothetical protein